MTKQRMEPVSDNEGLASNYVAKWAELLEHKKINTSEIGATGKNINIVRILTPLAEEGPKTTEGPDVGNFLANLSGEYLSKDYLAAYVPPNVHVIFYPMPEDENLFPNHDERVGFHLRRGGYPVALVPLRVVDPQNYRVEPKIVGHELGEVIISQMHKQEDGVIGRHIDCDHPLREGFCEMISWDYLRHFAKAQNVEFNHKYNLIYERVYRENNLEQLLDDAPYLDLSDNEKQFLDYTISGAIVMELEEKFGTESVIKYFALEAKKAVARNQEFKAKMDELSQRTNGLLKVDMTIDPIRKAPDRKDLREILNKLGYSVEQFQAISVDNLPIDDRPEGAIAILIADQFAHWFPEQRNDRTSQVMQEQFVGREKPVTPTYIQRVKGMIDSTLGREAFGEEFDFEEFIDHWKGDFISKYQSINSTPSDH